MAAMATEVSPLGMYEYLRTKAQEAKNDRASKDGGASVPASDPVMDDSIISPSDAQTFLKSIDVVLAAVKRFGRGLAFSFNGGKDCTVLLHLLRIALALNANAEAPVVDDSKSRADSSTCASTASASGNGNSATMKDILTVYFNTSSGSVVGDAKQVRCLDEQWCPTEFPEVREFINTALSSYNLQLCVLTGSFKQALRSLVEEQGVKAVLMGQRRTDPHAGFLQTESPSDVQKGWPAFLRINALLDWSYKQVWQFLLVFKLPYCSLYDAGYTSLGSRSDTYRNPALEYPKGSGVYRPAYMLSDIDGTLERSGRGQTQHQASAASTPSSTDAIRHATQAEDDEPDDTVPS